MAKKLTKQDKLRSPLMDTAFGVVKGAIRVVLNTPETVSALYIGPTKGVTWFSSLPARADPGALLLVLI